MAEYQDITVAARSKHDIEVHIEAGRRVEWDVEVLKDADVVLGVFLAGEGEGAQTDFQVPLSISGKDVNAIVMPRGGVFTIRLDNSSSLITSKAVRVAVRQSEDTPEVWLSDDPALTGRPIGAHTPAHLRHILAVMDRDMAHADIHDTKRMNDIVLRTCYLFFTNRFDWSERTVKRHFRRSVIFCLAYATVHVMVAVLSWNEEDIEESRRRAAAALALATAMQPSTSWFGGSTPPTPSQVEGCLVGAEVSLVNAFLAVLEENMLALAKCGLAVHSGLKLYGQVDAALDKLVTGVTSQAGVSGATVVDPGFKYAAQAVDVTAAVGAGLAPLIPPTPEGEEVPPAQDHNGMPAAVVSGGLFGLGMFNLMTSSMPDIVLRVVEFFGYPASKPAGIAQLRACMLGRSVRGPLGGLSLLIEQVQLPSFLSDAALRRRSATAAEEVLGVMFDQFPNSAFFLWNAGRSERMRWQLGLADALLAECASMAAASAKFKALANVAAYDRAFCYLFVAPGGKALARELLALPTDRPAYLDGMNLRSMQLAAEATEEGAPATGAGGGGGADIATPPALLLAREDVRSCWTLALRQVTSLQDGRLWSQAFFTYVTAMCHAEDCSPGEAAPLFQGVVDQMGRKLAGKRISAEQFVLRKVEAFQTALSDAAPVYREAVPAVGAKGPEAGLGCPRYLLLPGLEVIYLFNGFPCMDPRVAAAAVVAVDDALVQIGGLPAPSTEAAVPPGALRHRSHLTLHATHEQVTAFLDAAYCGYDGEGAVGALLRAEGSEEAGVSEGGAKPPLPPTPAVVPPSPTPDTEAVLRKRRKSTAPGTGSSLAFWRKAPEDGDMPHPPAEERVHSSGVLRADLVAVAAVLRGAALTAAGLPAQALACFQWVREHKEQITADNYTVPFAYYEMATLLGPTPEGHAMLKRAKDYSKDFNFKMRLHLRLHLLAQAWKAVGEE